MDKIIVFEDKKIRRVWFNEEWWFAAVDLISVLTDSKDPKRYLKDMRRRDSTFSEAWGQIATPLPLDTIKGTQKINCISLKGAFRLIQSIPSKKAEPFKQWLAQVGYERVLEIENPELAQDRARKYYELKGYPNSWIEKRLRGIAIRQDLIDEWKNRGVENEGFPILTNEIHKATFEININEHKKIKGLNPKLKNQNLRDNLTDLELIFNMLGEASTTEITKKNNSQGFKENKLAAKKGGKIAGDARKNLELETNEKIVSNKNYHNIKKKIMINND